MEPMLWVEPIIFSPVYKEKVWGGRNLHSLFGRELPNGANYGESWELVDREREQVVIRNGPAAGRTLHDLWIHQQTSVFGSATHPSPRFPLLAKILDARNDLSIQVHPPAHLAPSLNGEPKTEMWYIAHAEPGAKLYVGLKRGVNRAEFESGIAGGMTETQVHAIEPRQDEFIFIPSGRLHAIGAGLIIYEFQQNSDTTYRVFDWNRPGTDGKPRNLHVEESLQCIDFQDVEPVMDAPRGEILVHCDHFCVLRRHLPEGEAKPAAPEDAAALVTVISGSVRSGGHCFGRGDFFLVPARAKDAVRNLTSAAGNATVLLTHLPP